MERQLAGDALVRAAISLAIDAHAGQVSPDGEPYAAHPIHAAMQMRLASPEQVAACLLHDVVEDTPMTFADLEDKGFPPRVINAVEALTRRGGETYGDYIGRICGNADACRVKLADIADNRRPGDGFSESLQRRYDAATLAIRASMLSDGENEDMADFDFDPDAPDDPYGWLLRARCAGVYAAAAKVCEKVRDCQEWELSFCVWQALCDPLVPGDVLCMLLISTSTLDVEHMKALVEASVDSDGIDARNLKLARNTDTPAGELAWILAAHAGR